MSAGEWVSMMAQFSTVEIELRRDHLLPYRSRLAGSLRVVMLAVVVAGTVNKTAAAFNIFAISFPTSSRSVFSCEESNLTDEANSLLPNSPSSTVQALNILPAEKAASQNFVSPAGWAAVQTIPPELKLRRWRTDRAVIASTIYEAGWLIADGMTTVRIHGGAVEAGSAWAYGKHPEAGRVSAMMAAEFVGVEASSYLLHKMRAPMWIYIAPMIVSGSYHASGAVGNIRVGQ